MADYKFYMMMMMMMCLRKNAQTLKRYSSKLYRL